ncbi:sensor histidine kinase [Roseateles albus]|uniref:histidine kinase n=1 Tax=Roseateles albus TaxID=2987525 RepID=A0ABT5K8R8_9BURK|nr:HAMP domain-containing sensor histidine kinase [Roseateles albus]
MSIPARAYEEKAFALYFAYEIPFPYVGVTLMALTCVGLMYGHVPTLHIAIWFVVGGLLSLLREVFVWRMKPRLEKGEGYRAILWGFTLSSFLTGATWGAFTWMYFDASRPLSLLMAGSVVAGLAGGAVAPVSIFLPAFYAAVLPTVLPFVVLLALAGGGEHYTLAGLTLVFLASTSGYAHVTNRLHRESMRLRFENQQLIEDLGERRAAAENASQAKSLFLAGVSHDLKQPIRALGLYLGVLSQTQSQDCASTVATVAPKMANALGELHGQVTRLLELSRLESGALQLQMGWVELPQLFADLHALFEAQVSSKGICLRFAAVDGLHRTAVWVDKKMLESILQNLISNAIKHTAAGSVYVGVRLRTGYPLARQLCLEVRDSGSGIALEQQKHLFDAYRSFDDRKASESHGLGLAIAKAQATYLGCDIALQSKMGKGSTFTLCGLQTSPV